MTRTATIGAALLVLIVTGAGGCSRNETDGSLKDWALNTFTLNRPGPQQALGQLDDPDPDKRREAIVVLSSRQEYLQEPHTKFYSLALVNDSDALVRAAAARALGLAGDPNYLPQLVAGLEDPSPVVRGDVAWALNRVPGELATGPLKKHATQDASPDVRAGCCQALRCYSASSVGETLMRALRDPDLNVRRQARFTLSEITGVDVGDRPEDWSVQLEHEAASGR